MHPDILGWIAAALMVATFSCREARTLRPLAVATNLAFIGYGLMANLMPVLVLHLALLPINLWRCAQAYAVSAKALGSALERGGRVLCTVALASLPLLAGCGGGGDEASSPAPVSPSPPSAPPVTGTPNTVGAEGGTVAHSDGAEVSVPAGALMQEVAIEVAADPAGAPALPAGLAALGKVYAFTPHGTTFGRPVQVTLPFDPGLAPAGVAPRLYKADGTGPAADVWREVTGAVVQGGKISAEITSFSYLQAVAPLQLKEVWRSWEFHHLYRDGRKATLASDSNLTDEMAVVGSYDVGPRHLGNERARAVIFSSSDGGTYGTGVQSPAGRLADEPIGVKGLYYQHQYFRKREASATLSFVISQAFIRAIDFTPTEIECELVGTENRHCRLMRGHIDFSVKARDYTTKRTFFYRASGIALLGAFDEWLGGAFDTSATPLWRQDDFALVKAAPHEASVQLIRPLRIHVPLEDIPVGHEIVLSVLARVDAQDERQKESMLDVFFRDPQDLGKAGVGLESTGLDPLPLRDKSAPTFEVLPAPACTGAADPLAGTLQFESDKSQLSENSGLGSRVYVTRAGGTRGEVSARIRSVGGSAVPGKHYQPISQVVAFADGEAGRRAVFVPLVNDSVDEGTRTVQLELSEARGCAVLGVPAAATLTIADDDYVVVVQNQRVGGTVSGLVGSGLVLEDRARFVDLPVAVNGVFQFGGGYPAGAAYDVHVKAPPTNPAQTCTVTRGSGIVGTADVADIEVSCTTPPPPSGLDTGFGALGKVADGLLGGARAIARQSTGHILATNGASLVRYHADGRLDTSFNGGTGKVDNLLTGSGADVADIAVGSDDRIVVAGRILQTGRSVPFYQIAAARFNPDGTRDSGFGSGGQATVRLAGIAENATRVLVQPDGRVLLVGQATFERGPFKQADSDIVVVRLAADGAVDTGFGTNGATLADAYPRDFAFAAALQLDGRIFVAGRTTPPNAQFGEDTLFTRLTSDGAIEPGFGRSPAYSQSSDEAVDVALQPDGKIVLLVAGRGTHAEVVLVRIHPDGNLDTGFGNNGLARSDIGPHDDLPRAVALQADGKIVVAAQVSNDGRLLPSFAVLRYDTSGVLDATFGTSGVLRVPWFGGRDTANDLLVQPDGRIVVGGSWTSGTSAGIALIRLIP